MVKFYKLSEAIEGDFFMIKKSELYRAFIEEFLNNQFTQQNKDRISALGAKNQEIINIAQQAGSEAAAEILINVLVRFGLIENDCEITANYRTNTILECSKKLDKS